MTKVSDCGMDSADSGLDPLNSSCERGTKHLGPI
jgi:hypothetical protein